MGRELRRKALSKIEIAEPPRVLAARSAVRMISVADVSDFVTPLRRVKKPGVSDSSEKTSVKPGTSGTAGFGVGIARAVPVTRAAAAKGRGAKPLA